MEYNVTLSNRNKNVYGLVDNKLITDDSCAIVSAPGTGKSFISMELVSRNRDKDILYLAPTKAILNQYKRHMAEEGLLGDVNPDNMEEVDRRLKIYYPKLQLHTYSWFHLHQTNGDLDNENYDYVICDEYHHTGGDKWYISFNDFKSKHKNTKYFGMSATPQRMDGQATMFSYDNDVVYEYSLAEAIVDGELDIPIYVDCGIRYMGEILKSRQTIIDEFPEGKDKQELLKQINSFIHNINSYGGLSDIFSKYIPDNSKVLYFCPPSNSIDKKNNTKAIYEAYNNRDKMFCNIDSDIRYYISFGEYKDSEKEEEAFINDNELGIKVLYTVNKYSEGVHSENTNVLVMGRGTFSVPLFTQQLGRGLVAGRNNGERVIVLDLVGNIHIYQEIVEEVRREVDKRISKGRSLPKGVSKEEFMSKFEIHDLELGQKEFLDYLNNLIRDNRNMYYRDSILSWVNKIEEYCKNNGEWPKNKNKYKYVSDSDLTTSDRLSQWLSYSGYNKGEFKYKDIEDENGKLIIDRLNYLHAKYCDEVRMVNKIEDYCKNNGEWPKAYIKDIYVSEVDLTTSHQLSQWLNNSTYNKGEFKYKDIEDENGKLIIDRLNYLHAKYRVEVRWVNKIEEYCKNNGEWPKHKIKDKYVSESDLTTSDQLAKWLRDSGYNKGEFKYKDIKDEKNDLIIDKLNYLHAKYRDEVRWVNKIEEYCKNNREWPKGCVKEKYVSKSDLTTSHQLAQWLNYSGYNSDEFRYKYIGDESGKLIIDRLKCLQAKYCYEVIMVEKIEEYCKNNGEWPKQNIKDKYVSECDLTTSDQLAVWLINSKYNKENFKYKDIKDENGVSIYDRLNELYSIFNSNNNVINKMDEYDKNYNLKVASKSDDYIFKLYYLIIELMNSYYDKNINEFNKCIGIIDNIIIDNDIGIDIKEIVNSFDLSSDEMVEYYLEGYTNNSIQNNVDKALLYKRLYNYVVVLDKGSNKMR